MSEENDQPAAKPQTVKVIPFLDAPGLHTVSPTYMRVTGPTPANTYVLEFFVATFRSLAQKMELIDAASLEYRGTDIHFDHFYEVVGRITGTKEFLEQMAKTISNHVQEYGPFE